MMGTTARVQNNKNSSPSNSNNSEKKNGWRSRGWTPLKYPKSAVLQNNNSNENNKSFVHFPLHQDVMLATVRELLILDGTVEASTLKVQVLGSSKACYKRHLDPEYFHNVTCASGGQEKEHCSADLLSKRKKLRQPKKPHKRIKREEQSDDRVQVDADKCTTRPLVFVEIKAEEEETERLPSAEDIASAILRRSRLSEKYSLEQQQQSPVDSNAIVPQQHRPPRKVSEADQSSSPASPMHYSYNAPLSPHRCDGASLEEEENEDFDGSQEISQALDLNKRSPDGSFAFSCASVGGIANMLHASIFNEALLRDAAMTMTHKLIASFSDQALRLFFGYKTPVISRTRLTQLLAGFMFDTSHAIFAWEQTEQEVLLARHARKEADNKNNTSLDTVIRESLFDDRALKKIGGFGPASVLPHAISIGRLRRRHSAWAFFATTAQGKRMLEHHSRGEKSIISVGKQRRGQRLRQRHWLTSNLMWQEQQHESSDASVITAPRSRSCSLASEAEAAEPASASASSSEWKTTAVDMTRQARILADMPGSKAISLTKQTPDESWGVGLAKEGGACVVGRAKDRPGGSREDQYLRCGDMIIHAQNERGQEACSPLCARSNTEYAGEDWFRTMVDLFKTSKEIHLVIQRV